MLSLRQLTYRQTRLRIVVTILQSPQVSQYYSQEYVDAFNEEPTHCVRVLLDNGFRI